MNRHRGFLLLPSALAVVVALVFAGCDSLLDVDPKQEIREDRALETPSNVRAALIGAYDMLGDYDLYGGQFMMLPDLLGDDDDLNWTGTFSEPREVWVKNIQVDNGFVEDQWMDSYDAINMANNVLSALEVFEEEGERNRVEGEALFIRSALYFELVRLYARAWNDGDPSSNPGVPLILEPTREITEEDNVSRSTVETVYDQAIQDLSAAKDLLPEDNDVYADTYAASALLSRVYLMQGQYEEAAQEASRVIESGRYNLAESFAGVFNNTEDIAEYIFAIQVTTQDGDHSLNTFYGAEPKGRGDIDITDNHLARYEDGDTRAEFFYIDGADRVRTSKWRDGDVDGVNIPVIRLAEMYLTRAEGNFRAGTSIGGVSPLEDINTIRERAEVDPLGSVTIEDILQERWLELAFEGHQLHDLKRTGRPNGSIAFDANNLIYPIPERETDANPNLEQNAGY